MKKILIILILITGTLAAQPVHRQHGEGCTKDQGHVMIALDSVHRGDTDHYLDSLLINGTMYEHRVIVDSDTMYYACLRCDSTIYFFHDTIYINLEEIRYVVTPDPLDWEDINDNPPGTGTGNSATITGINVGITLFVEIEEYIDGVLRYKINDGDFINIIGAAVLTVENNDTIDFLYVANDDQLPVTVKIYNYSDNMTEIDSFTVESSAP